jgi:hypothetical protein
MASTGARVPPEPPGRWHAPAGGHRGCRWQCGRIWACADPRQCEILFRRLTEASCSSQIPYTAKARRASSRLPGWNVGVLPTPRPSSRRRSTTRRPDTPSWEPSYTGALYESFPAFGVIARFGVGHDGIDSPRDCCAVVVQTRLAS